MHLRATSALGAAAAAVGTSVQASMTRLIVIFKFVSPRGRTGGSDETADATI